MDNDFDKMKSFSMRARAEAAHSNEFAREVRSLVRGSIRMKVYQEIRTIKNELKNKVIENNG